MITRITGLLIRLESSAAVIAAGAFEYEVFIPEFVRRQLQGQIDNDVSLLTIEYLEGNPARGNLIPRMIGFTSDGEQALALLRRLRPHVALLDEDLPGFGGSAVARIIARELPDVQVMVLRN